MGRPRNFRKPSKTGRQTSWFCLFFDEVYVLMMSKITPAMSGCRAAFAADDNDGADLVEQLCRAESPVRPVAVERIVDRIIRWVVMLLGLGPA